MAKREFNRLVDVADKTKALNVRTISEPGYYCDGLGLYLRVLPTGGKSWCLIFQKHGRRQEMMIGPYPDTSLIEARAFAAVARNDLRTGINPIDKRKAARAALMLDVARATTFKAAAESYIASQRSGWKNAKHAQQWENTLTQYVYPQIGKLPVADIDKALVMRCLTPIWNTKPETASRVRGRIESVLGWARAQDLRSGENPAAWRGNLEHLLPAPKSVKPVEHHPAMPVDQVPAFVQGLRKHSGVSARALEFAILSACRTSEIIGARWSEIDLEKQEWVIPAARMKAKKEHRVPLTPRMVQILTAMQPLRQSDDEDETDCYVFPGVKHGRPLSNMSMATLTDGTPYTVHGFRSSFRDWGGESDFPREVVEHALAHQLKDKAEAAYARGTLFNKRRKLMEAWGTYCESTGKPGGKVVNLRTFKKAGGENAR